MRLWTLRPSYLDRMGLVALWREALLAQAVLRLETYGYRHHPQLFRFQGREGCLGSYLQNIATEAESRGYKFNRDLIRLPVMSHNEDKIEVSLGQCIYEYQHLLHKLEHRAPDSCIRMKWDNDFPEITNSIFRVNMDNINKEPWEK